MSALALSIVVPVYNEAPNLANLIARLNMLSEKLRQAHGLDISYIFVDDGSRDDSYAVLTSLDFQGNPARILQFSRNFGKEAALSAGIDASVGADATIFMDADLQHPPELVVEMVEIWLRDDVDSVYTYKSDRLASEGLARSVFSRMFYKTMNRGGRYQLVEGAGDFRLVNRRFADALRRLPESERFMKGLYAWVGFTQRGIPLTPPPREHGVSSFNTLKLLTMSFDALTSFTTAPLRLMALTGVCIALLSGLYGIYIVLERLFFESSGIGISSILTLVSFFGGVQMIFLGLLGEYVGKAVLEAKRRPCYLIAEDRTIAVAKVATTPDPRTEGSIAEG
ncbi:glycosyltransferase family 2 protein [Martelella alba]|uniref:Glycosyltransferase family 2 protein n=1 Tax=Martelella alba TaxID=2590451 RepID=A0A506UB07_9HYPH|nr:glycosyltransferase family 2 protein [Martelella alba]TPW31592.1 glycosyltransferase family 2 protein [Martelella alba]